jgi:hypothetical protein
MVTLKPHFPYRVSHVLQHELRGKWVAFVGLVVNHAGQWAKCTDASGKEWLIRPNQLI